jgi:hypothetical protein
MDDGGKDTSNKCRQIDGYLTDDKPKWTECRAPREDDFETIRVSVEFVNYNIWILPSLVLRIDRREHHV